jgi:hypothetical protein
MSRMKLPKKSNCESTTGGARAQEGLETVMGQAPLPREGGAWERAPRFAGQPPAEWSLPPGGEWHKGANRGDPIKDPVNLRCPRPDSGLHTPRPRDGHGRGSGWCHPQEDDPLQAPHPLPDGDLGIGSGRFEGVKDSGVPVEDKPRTGHRLRIREECRAHFS